MTPMPKMKPLDPKAKKALEAKANEVIEIVRAMGKKELPYMEFELDALTFVYVHGVGEKFGVDIKRRVFCDPAYVVAAGPEQILADLLHEVIVHLLPDHFIRADEFPVPKEDRKIWNVAGDASGNPILFEMASKSNGRIRPFGVKITEENLQQMLMETQFVTPQNQGLPPNGSVEEYFVELKNRKQPEGGGKGPKPPPGNEPGDDEGGGEGENEGDDESEGGGEGNGPPKQGQKPGKPSRKPGQCGGCGGDSDLTDELEQKAREQGTHVPEGRTMLDHKSISQQTAQAIKEHAEGRGHCPAGLKRWAEAQLKPAKVNWKKHLRSMVTKGVGKARGMQDFTNSKLRRREGLILPTMYAPTPTVALVLDTSGSMSDNDLAASLREAKGVFKILQEAGAVEVHITACDTQATKPVKLKRWNQQKVQELLVGGGGTDMGAGIEAAATAKPAITVVLTDGDTGWPDTKPRGAGKVIVALTRPTSCPTPKWTTVVKAFDEKD